MKITAIGIIRSPFKAKEKTPIQPTQSNRVGCVKVFKKFADGLKDIDGFSHLILLYQFHRSRGYELVIKPFLDNKPHGIFATRFPRRPNPIGISVVRLLKRKETNLLVSGIDVLDGTPLLDIKPYVPDFSAREPIRIGWLKTKLIKNKRRTAR